MITRSSSVLLSLTSLMLGVVLGAMLERGGPTVSAQVAVGTASGETAGSPSALSRPATAKTASGPDANDALYDTLAKQYRQFEQVNRTFELVSKAVSPSVVHIVAQKISRPEATERNRRVRQFEETGSGVIVRSDREAGLFVLTNHHVIEGTKASRIRIHLHDGRTITPDRVWHDSKADIAVLRLQESDLPAARLGDSDRVAVGSWVLALGSPFGLMQSVSQGIISARGRHVEELPDIENQDFLQTDAAINPGNSGGPLVNMKGEVIGINNSIASNGGGNEGVGFSIPINLARWIMGELVAHGHVSRGALGVDLNPEFRQEDAVELGLERPRGARILVVYPLSPAARGGLQDGDVVLRFGGVEIVDLNHLINAVSMAPIGEVADLVVWRDRRELKLKVTIGERDRTPSPSSPPLPSPSPSPGEEPPATRNENPSNLVRRPERPSPSPSFVMGLELATLNANAAKSLSLPEEWKGAVIVRVDNASPLAGICQVNDVISSVDGQVVASAEKAVELLNARGDHGSLTLGLDRLTRGVIERRTVRVP